MPVAQEQQEHLGMSCDPKGRLLAPAHIFYWDREQTGHGAAQTPLPLLAPPAPVPPCGEPHRSPLTLPSLSPAPPHSSGTQSRGQAGPSSASGASAPPPQPCPAQPGCGDLLCAPCSGWLGCWDGRRDALGRQKSLLWEAHQEGHCTGERREGRAGGITWCPHPGCLRRPSSLPPLSSGHPC